ncbi:MAG: response regulator [Desulfuromonas sp.]|nr:response regulator [Desulfuromonas sp.]
MTNILIVEDEPRVAKLLEDYLCQAGFAVHSLAEGLDVTAYVRENCPQLILLDLMLPGKDGMSICREIRTFSNVPIVMITARVEEIDRLLGLELGADDYICKPFSPREVVARVKAVLRRSCAANVEPLSMGLHLDESRYIAQIDGTNLDLTAVEFQLLKLLFAKPGHLFSRQQLMDNLYQDQRIVADRTIDSHIKKLRKKIAAVCPNVDMIHSVYGVGYKYEELHKNV